MNSFERIWQSRKIILHFSIIEFKLKYRGTILGFLWSILEPLAQLGILYLVFTSIRPTNENFLVYLFSGLIIIHFFIRSTTQSLNSIANKKSIIISLNTPKMIFPLSIVLTNLYTFSIEIFLCFLFIIILQIEVTDTIAVLPLVLIILVIFSTGVSLLCSAVRLFFKDIQSVWSIVTMSLIFITPVFWKVSEMPKNIADIFLLNPLALIMEMIHKVVLYGTLPTSQEFGYALFSAISILVLSWFVLIKIEKRIVEMM